MSITSFAELGLRPELLRAVEEAGYTTPTPIQVQAIPVILAGKDVMGGARPARARPPASPCRSCRSWRRSPTPTIRRRAIRCAH